MADRDRERDGDAAQMRLRRWAGAEDEPNAKSGDAHPWYDADTKDGQPGCDDRWTSVRGSVSRPELPLTRVSTSQRQFFGRADRI